MAFQILKPEIKSIQKAVWDTIKVQWQFWSIFAIAFISSVALWIIVTFKMLGDWDISPEIIFVPFFIVAIYIGLTERQVRTSFWKQFAKLNGWQYKHHGDPNHRESGVMFRQGNKNYISHIIEGSTNDRCFRIFNFYFTKGSGESKTTYYYTVFAFKFNGSFPHVYLNNRYNSYSISVGEKIPLSGEFEKKFSLSAPKEYEIEALEIFTPDVLTRLLDGGFTYDVELVDREVLVFTDGRIYDFEKLEKEFKRALELENLFDEKLDKFKFQPIGDMPHTL